MQQVTIRVLYFGPSRQAVPVPEETVTLPAGATVGDLFDELTERHGQPFRDSVLWVDGNPLPNATIIVDGRNIQHLRGMQTPLERDSATHIVLLTASVGGG